jgi:hypothetical protein
MAGNEGALSFMPAAFAFIARVFLEPGFTMMQGVHEGETRSLLGVEAA